MVHVFKEKRLKLIESQGRMLEFHGKRKESITQKVLDIEGGLGSKGMII